jgi:predicted transposase/invertase (TIGR01784 family)
MLHKFLNPKNDAAFKRIFGSENNKDLLIHFLNSVFAGEKPVIESINFLNPIQLPKISTLRESILELLCEATDGSKFIIEMQLSKQEGFLKRTQYYAAKTYVEQRVKDLEFKDLNCVIFLAISAHKLFADHDYRYLKHHVILDKDTHAHHLDAFSFSFIELPNFQKSITELSSPMDKWIYFLKHAEDISQAEFSRIIERDPVLTKAFQELDSFAWTPAELSYYTSMEMKISGQQDAIKTAAREGKAEGRAEGLVEGLVKGRAEGETTKAIEIAKRLLQLNLPLADITAATGLSLAQIQAIQISEPEISLC